MGFVLDTATQSILNQIMAFVPRRPCLSLYRRVPIGDLVRQSDSTKCITANALFTFSLSYDSQEASKGGSAAAAAVGGANSIGSLIIRAGASSVLAVVKHWPGFTIVRELDMPPSPPQSPEQALPSSRTRAEAQGRSLGLNATQDAWRRSSPFEAAYAEGEAKSSHTLAGTWIPRSTDVRGGSIMAQPQPQSQPQSQGSSAGRFAMASPPQSGSASAPVEAAFASPSNQGNHSFPSPPNNPYSPPAAHAWASASSEIQRVGVNDPLLASGGDATFSMVQLGSMMESSVTSPSDYGIPAYQMRSFASGDATHGDSAIGRGSDVFTQPPASGSRPKGTVGKLGTNSRLLSHTAASAGRGSVGSGTAGGRIPNAKTGLTGTGTGAAGNAFSAAGTRAFKAVQAASRLLATGQAHNSSGLAGSPRKLGSTTPAELWTDVALVAEIRSRASALQVEAQEVASLLQPLMEPSAVAHTKLILRLLGAHIVKPQCSAQEMYGFSLTSQSGRREASEKGTHGIQYTLIC